MAFSVLLSAFSFTRNIYIFTGFLYILLFRFLTVFALEDPENPYIIRVFRFFASEPFLHFARFSLRFA